MGVLPKLIYRLRQYLSKFQQGFCRHREAYAKLIWNDAETRINKLILERRNKVGRTTVPHTVAYWIAIVVKTG